MTADEVRSVRQFGTMIQRIIRGISLVSSIFKKKDGQYEYRIKS